MITIATRAALILWERTNLEGLGFAGILCGRRTFDGLVFLLAGILCERKSFDSFDSLGTELLGGVC
jgi:hypothetical protein